MRIDEASVRVEERAAPIRLKMGSDTFLVKGGGQEAEKKLDPGVVVCRVLQMTQTNRDDHLLFSLVDGLVWMRGRKKRTRKGGKH